MELPDDPMMLFSMVNMKLRDCYHSLDELCDDMNVDKELLVKKLRRPDLSIVRKTTSLVDRGISPFRKNVWNGLIFLLRYLLIIFV